MAAVNNTAPEGGLSLAVGGATTQQRARSSCLAAEKKSSPLFQHSIQSPEIAEENTPFPFVTSHSPLLWHSHLVFLSAEQSGFVPAVMHVTPKRRGDQ